MRRYPIHPDDRKSVGFEVPWDLVAAHRKQAMVNHSQTIERLAERGGLSVIELYYCLREEKVAWDNLVSKETATAYLSKCCEEWKAIHGTANETRAAEPGTPEAKA